jgi:hypothetical protein
MLAGSGRAIMTAITPVPDSVQRLQALQHANKVRAVRAAVKREIATGGTSAAQAILSGPSEIQSMAIIDLLMSQRGWGRARCRWLLLAIPLSENKTIGSMTDRQQRLVLAMLRAANEPRRVQWSGHNNDQPLGPYRPAPG